MLITRRGRSAGPGLLLLPGGDVVRGSALARVRAPADFTLVLGRGPAPAWAHRRVAWPDFWVPTDRTDAVDGLHELLDRARAGEQVELARRGGTGRTGTALAALAVLDGDSAEEAVRRVRARYHPRAVETPWQRRWVRSIAP